MPRSFNVAIRDQTFAAKAGARLLDEALKNGVDLPHDCRAGQCGACTVELIRGITLGGEVGCGNILACQARVFSDLEVAQTDAPDSVQRNAVVEEIGELCKGVLKVTIRPRRPIDWLPGQYMKLQFRGYPARCFSPTARLSDGVIDDRLIFHIKQVRGGLVTPKLGCQIGVGSKLQVSGPFGHAFLRDDQDGRIVLLASGTGFAPIWAIAAAAHTSSPDRPMHLICGAKDVRALYMGPALQKADRHSGTSVQIVLETLHPSLAGVRYGTPADYVPALSDSDIVFAAGSPQMVEEARRKAEIAGARFYADPFTPSAPPAPNLAGGLKRVARFFGSADARH